MAHMMNVVLQRHFRIERIFRDRNHPFDIFGEEEPIQRFKFGREGINNILNLIEEDIDNITNRSVPVQTYKPLMQCLQFHKACVSKLHSIKATLSKNELDKPIICSDFSKRCFSNSGQIEESEEEDSLFKRIELEIKAHDPVLLKSYEKFVTMTANELDITISDIFYPKKVIEKYSLLKSAHVHKKHFVQYETRTHFTVIELKHLTGSTADTFLEYIERNLSEGIAMKVTRHKIERLPDYIKPPHETSSEETLIDGMSSEETLIDGMSSDETSSVGTSSDQISSDETSSDQISSDRTSSDGTSSDETSSDGTSSDETSSDGTSSDGMLSDGTSSDGMLSDGTSSDGTSSDEKS